MVSTTHTALSTRKKGVGRHSGSCLVLSAYGFVLLFTTGCLRRSLTIRTDPPGALVYVNDQLKGTSPITYDFTWYGWHRVILRKEGYERIEDRKLLRAPFYLWIPLDLVMELVPFPIRDVREWSYALKQMATLPTPVPPALPPPKATGPPTSAQAAEAPSTQADASQANPSVEATPAQQPVPEATDATR